MISIIDQQKKCNQIISVLCHDCIERRRKSGNLLDVLIATILSQNTNDVLSLQAYGNLKTAYPVWEVLLKVPQTRIAKLIQIGGLAKQKSEVIKNLIKYLHIRNGKVDLNYLLKMSDEEIFSELGALKGIGNKTISCLLLFGMNKNSFPVDTHIHRICNRIGLVNTKNANETYLEMKSLVPQGKEYSFHIELIRFGRNICSAKNPECYNCQLIDICDYENKNWKRPKKESATKRKNVFILNKI